MSNPLLPMASRKAANLAQSLPEAPEAVLEAAQIDPEAWDVLLVGDGSGSARGRPCGFGCVSYERGVAGTRLWWGGFSDGTSNMAEIAAYLLPLEMLAARAKLPGVGRFTRVWIVTDSAYVHAVCQNDPAATRANPGWWAALCSYGRFGMLIDSRWLRRDALAANRVADALSKETRLGQR